MSGKLKETSTTTLVLETLRNPDSEFMTRQMLQTATGRGDAPVSGALCHLRAHRCVDVVVNPDGTGWWFALPPELDTRKRTVDEHAPKTTGYKRHSKKREAK